MNLISIILPCQLFPPWNIQSLNQPSIPLFFPLFFSSLLPPYLPLLFPHSPHSLPLLSQLWFKINLHCKILYIFLKYYASKPKALVGQDSTSSHGGTIVPRHHTARAIAPCHAVRLEGAGLNQELPGTLALGHDTATYQRHACCWLGQESTRSRPGDSIPDRSTSTALCHAMQLPGAPHNQVPPNADGAGKSDQHCQLVPGCHPGQGYCWGPYLSLWPYSS